MPAISQCPVVVSFPGEASAHLPNAPAGSEAGSRASKGLIFASPSRHKFGRCSFRRFAILPRVSLPASPYCAASGISPIPTLSRTIQMTRSKADSISLLCRRACACFRKSVLNARRQKSSEGVRVESDHLTVNIPIFAQQNSCRNALNIERLRQTVGEVNITIPLMLVQKRRDHRRIVVIVDLKERHAGIVFELRLHLFEKRMLLAARTAPGCPEIHYDHFASQRIKGEGFAVEAGEFIFDGTRRRGAFQHFIALRGYCRHAVVSGKHHVS